MAVLSFDCMDRDTSWGLIEEAASGDGPARSRFAGMYLPVVRAYLGARWRGKDISRELDDAVQEFFVECFRGDGILTRSEKRREDLSENGAGFRGFLLGGVRNIAMRFEKRWTAKGAPSSLETLHPSRVAEFEGGLSRVFDRAWAQSIMEQAANLMRTRADLAGGAHQRRVELLRMRFNDSVPIRDIAKIWGEDAKALHRELDKARAEFRDSLREVVGLHNQCSGKALEAEIERLLGLLQAGDRA